MEATTTNKVGGSSPRDVLSTRGGAIAVAAAAAALAGILLFVFVQRYRSNQNSSTALTPVFVAKSLIPQGSSADLVGSQELLQRTSVRGSQLQAGAITDPRVLHGEVAVTNIYPGQQITASDFTASGTVAAQLAGTQRGIAVPVDAAHGLVGFIHAGDHVDALASFSEGSGRGTVTRLAQNVLVLNAPSSNGGVVGSSGNNDIVLAIEGKDARAFAFAADNGKVWVIMRPPLGATQATTSQSETTTTGSSGH